jgi:hypothetical protein
MKSYSKENAWLLVMLLAVVLAMIAECSVPIW